MRNETLPRAAWPSKSSCVTPQALALPLVSTRPLMTNSECTPPSREPFEPNLKRASRTGPFRVMKDGTLLRAPNAVARVNCGLPARTPGSWAAACASVDRPNTDSKAASDAAVSCDLMTSPLSQETGIRHLLRSNGSSACIARAADACAYSPATASG
jgi:hypothetical protein